MCRLKSCPPMRPLVSSPTSCDTYLSPSAPKRHRLGRRLWKMVARMASMTLEGRSTNISHGIPMMSPIPSVSISLGVPPYFSFVPPTVPARPAHSGTPRSHPQARNGFPAPCGDRGSALQRRPLHLAKGRTSTRHHHQHIRTRCGRCHRSVLSYNLRFKPLKEDCIPHHPAQTGDDVQARRILVLRVKIAAQMRRVTPTPCSMVRLPLASLASRNASITVIFL